MLTCILEHLQVLVGCDTQNPPREITLDHPVIRYCSSILELCGCQLRTWDHGNGCISLLATRGDTDTLLNCHLDTVPIDVGWNQDPFTLNVLNDRAIGLGACDIKGAAACMLAAAQQSDGPLAILFTTDEEAGQSTCVNEFLKSNTKFTRAIVAEPTSSCAVTAHRGIATFEMHFEGTAAHSSNATGSAQSANHQAIEWCARALKLTQTSPYDNIRFNIGKLEGGTKPNVIASSATVLWGMRPLGEMNSSHIQLAIKELVPNPDLCTWKSRFQAPGLCQTNGATAMIEEFGFKRANPVDFWTEAALFARAGLDAIVIGPGHIDQAHRAGEFVMLDDLVRACQAYTQVFLTQTIHSQLVGSTQTQQEIDS